MQVSPLGRMSLAFLLVVLLHQARAHNTAICASTAPSVPGMATIWVGTYHVLKSPAQGTGWLETPAGVRSAYAMEYSCSPKPGSLVHENMASWSKMFRSDFSEGAPTTPGLVSYQSTCRDLRYKGRPLMAADSITECYTLDKCKNGNPSDPKRWARIKLPDENPGTRSYGN
jgi:hypothetical protein